MRVLLFVFFIAGFGFACSSSGSKSVETDTQEELNLPSENQKLVNLDVKGMTCEGCENAVVASIKKLDGIQEANASHTSENTLVAFDSTKTSIEAISQAIVDAGYKVEGEKDQALQE